MAVLDSKVGWRFCSKAVPVILASVLIVSLAPAEELVEETFENIKISGINTPHDYEIMPDTVLVTLRWPASYFSESLSKKEIFVYIDLKELGPGVHACPAKIRLPKKARLIRVEPGIFTVTVTPVEKTGTDKK
ncbi:MAG: hypothetical protein ACOC8Q_00310 [Desulfosalsimonas sp.]